MRADSWKETISPRRKRQPACFRPARHAPREGPHGPGCDKKQHPIARLQLPMTLPLCAAPLRQRPADSRMDMAQTSASRYARFSSVPEYPPLALDPSARQHLFVADHAAPLGVGEDLGASLILGSAQTPDWPALQQALQQHLGQARMGLHLYVSGAERFLWQVHGLALEAGLGPAEIHLAPPRAQSLRSVYCVHCAHCGEYPIAATLACGNCSVCLEVRAHFSRRWGAYLGVCLNAAQPYARPQP